MMNTIARFKKEDRRAYLYDLTSDQLTLCSVDTFWGPVSTMTLLVFAASFITVNLRYSTSPLTVEVNLPLCIIIYHIVMIPIVLIMCREINAYLNNMQINGKPTEQTKQLLTEIVLNRKKSTVLRILFYAVLTCAIVWGYTGYVKTKVLMSLMEGAYMEILLFFLLYFGCEFQNIQAIKRFKEKLKAME